MSCICKLLLACCNKSSPLTQESEVVVSEPLYTVVRKVDGRGSIIVEGALDLMDVKTSIQEQRPLPSLPVTRGQRERWVRSSIPEPLNSPETIRALMHPLESPSLPPLEDENGQLIADKPQQEELQPPCSPRLTGRESSRDHTSRLPENMCGTLCKQRDFSMNARSEERDNELANFYAKSGRKYNPAEHLTSTNTIFRTLVLSSRTLPADNASGDSSK